MCSKSKNGLMQRDHPRNQLWIKLGIVRGEQVPYPLASEENPKAHSHIDRVGCEEGPFSPAPGIYSSKIQTEKCRQTAKPCKTTTIKAGSLARERKQRCTRH